MDELMAGEGGLLEHVDAEEAVIDIEGTVDDSCSSWIILPVVLCDLQEHLGG